MKRETKLKDLAWHLRLHPRSVNRLMKDEYKDIPREGKDGDWWFNMEEVINWLENKFNREEKNV